MLMVFVNVAWAKGNFNLFNTTLVNNLKFTPGPEINGFKMYKSADDLQGLGVLLLENWVIESFIICRGDVSVRDLIKSIAVVYGFVQDTRWVAKDHPQDAEVIIAGGYALWEKRAEELLYSACKQLYHTKTTTFSFDNIQVKATDTGEVGWHTHTKDRSYDVKKIISIKLWMR
jgi:hypothetical protein